jgi:hypothetical protein
MTRNLEDLVYLNNTATNTNIVVPKHQNQDLVAEATTRLVSDNKECTSTKERTSILSALMGIISAVIGYIFGYSRFLDASFRPVLQYDKAGYVIGQKRRFNVIKKICLFPVFIIGHIITINTHRIHLHP